MVDDPFSENELMKIVRPPPPPLRESASESSSAARRSVFRPFVEGSRGFRRRSSSPSMNMRVIEFLRRDWSERKQMREPERQSSVSRHTRNERTRRERERQFFSELHYVLPRGTRNEKVSIMQAAATEIRRLERRKEELEARESRLTEPAGEGVQGAAKIEVRVEDPTSGIDSLVEILKRLKQTGVSTTAIRSQLEERQLSAVIETGSKVEAAEVDAAVQRALAELGR